MSSFAGLACSRPLDVEGGHEAERREVYRVARDRGDVAVGGVADRRAATVWRREDVRRTTAALLCLEVLDATERTRCCRRSDVPRDHSVVEGGKDEPATNSTYLR